MTADLEEKLRDFLAEVSPPENPEETIEPDTPLISSGRLSSIAVLSLVGLIEDNLGVELEAHEISPDTMDTLASIERLVRSKQAGASS